VSDVGLKTRKAETSRNQGSEIKRNCYVYQPIAPLSAPKIQEVIQLLDGWFSVWPKNATEFPVKPSVKIPRS
jgi:ATP-dependent DNA helicase 2 subunit 1